MRCYKCPYNRIDDYESTKMGISCALPIYEVDCNSQGDEGCKFTLAQLRKIEKEEAEKDRKIAKMVEARHKEEQ